MSAVQFSFMLLELTLA